MYFPKTKLYPDEYVYYLSTLMHETGHGLHFQYQDTKPLIFNFFDQTVTETIAIFFENILYSKECLEKYFPYKLTDDEIRIILANKKKSILEFFRFAVFLWNFEKSIYNNPDQDMSELYKTLAVKTHMPKTNQYRLWYDTSIFASHDLYYIHYTLAYLYAFKLRKLLEKKYGPNYYENPEVGNFLRENLFKYGNSLQPDKLFIRLFGDNILPINEYLAYLSE
jgi:peptidyl-dipeptidase A